MTAATDQHHQDTSFPGPRERGAIPRIPPARRWTRRFAAFSLLVGAAGISVLGSFIVGLLATYVQQNPDLFGVMPALTQWCLDQPARILLMGVPPAIIGVVMFAGWPRNTAGRWTLFALGMACLVGTLILVLYCFVTAMQPLYTSPQ